MQLGDVPVTYADTTPLREGLRRFAEWYGRYYGETK